MPSGNFELKDFKWGYTTDLWENRLCCPQRCPGKEAGEVGSHVFRLSWPHIVISSSEIHVGDSDTQFADIGQNFFSHIPPHSLNTDPWVLWGTQAADLMSTVLGTKGPQHGNINDWRLTAVIKKVKAVQSAQLLTLNKERRQITTGENMEWYFNSEIWRSFFSSDLMSQNRASVMHGMRPLN